MDKLALDILQQYGLFGLVIALQSAGLYYLWREYKGLQTLLLESLEKRVQDNKVSAEKYSQLSEDTHKTLDMVIRMVQNGQ